MNTITIELCAEDRQRLDVISDTLELIRLALTTAGTPFPAAPEQPQPEELPGQLSIEDGPAHAEVPPEGVQPKVERADIQTKVVELSAAGKKEAVRDIVNNYAKKVSDIPEDKLAEVWSRLTALEV